MLVKELLKVFNFTPNQIVDLNGNKYLLNGRKYAQYENMEVSEVTNKSGYITIHINSYGYDGEYKNLKV